MINETQEEINAYNQIRDLADKLLHFVVVML